MDFLHRIEDNIANAAPGSWLAVIGSLCGVLIGATIPIIKAYIDRHLQNKEDRKKIAIFFSHKLTYMISSVHLIQSHFEEGLSRAKAAGAHPGLKTQAMNRICDEINFSEDNIWAISQVCGAEGMNAFGFLDNQFNVLIRSVDHYMKLRAELQNVMPKMKVIDGKSFSYDFKPDDEDSGEVMLRITELDNLVLTLIENSRQHKAAAASALKVLLEAKRFPYPRMRLEFEPTTKLSPIAARRARPDRPPAH